MSLSVCLNLQIYTISSSNFFDSIPCHIFHWLAGGALKD